MTQGKLEKTSALAPGWGSDSLGSKARRETERWFECLTLRESRVERFGVGGWG